jgi:stage II sporulation protein P
MTKRRLQLLIGTGLLVLGAFLALYLSKGTLPAFSPGNIPDSVLNSAEACHVDGRVFSIKDGDDNLISKMSRLVSVGDQVITADGKVYDITRVNGQNATAEFQGMDQDFLAWQDFYSSQTVPVTNQQRENTNNKIAVYHTHSEESYVPTDGTESQPGNGGIFKVGNAFGLQLEKEGAEVIHDTSKHEPRDDNSYIRSRRTATQLLKSNPVALIDVHRDGIPDANYYRANINGEQLTQLRLVVGRQNPKMESNKDFATNVMAAVNKKYPGLIKEIFIAKGNYNQDLTPTAMLVEVGTHTNSREAAEKGATFFASALPSVLGIGKAGAAPGTFSDPNANTPGGWTSIGILLAVLVVGGGAFLLISSGNLKNAKDRLNSYFNKEFVNLLLPRRRKHKKKNEEGVYNPDANEAAKQRLDDIRKD